MAGQRSGEGRSGDDKGERQVQVMIKARDSPGDGKDAGIRAGLGACWGDNRGWVSGPWRCELGLIQGDVDVEGWAGAIQGHKRGLDGQEER